MDVVTTYNSNLEFRKIPSLQFLYEVNSNGTIFRNVKSKKQLRIKLDYHHSKAGYYCTFVNIKGQCIRVMIHSVVAECWLGPRPEGYEVDHRDRNSHNNDYRNLRYVTHSEQMKNRVLRDHVIAAATANCAAYVKDISIRCVVIDSRTNDMYHFRSATQAAYFIAYETGKTPEQVRGKLKQRRSHIYFYDIVYVNNKNFWPDSIFQNAETRRVGSTEQGIVHLYEQDDE